MADENQNAVDENQDLAETPADPNQTPPVNPEAGETPPVQETADTSKDEAPVEFDAAVWSDERDTTADSVFELLHKGGVSPEDAKALLWDAVQEGKPENVDRDALEAKVGKASAHLIMTGITTFIADREAKTEAAVKAVHEAAGGKDEWDAVAEWARASLDEAELAEYRTMIDAGGRSAAMAVREMVRQHNADPNTKSIGKEVEIRGDARNRREEPGITQRAYGDQLSLLHKKNYSPDRLAEELGKLKAARARGKRQGI